MYFWNNLANVGIYQTSVYNLKQNNCNKNRALLPLIVFVNKTFRKSAVLT